MSGISSREADCRQDKSSREKEMRIIQGSFEALRTYP
jgi:hypothetical protein